MPAGQRANGACERTKLIQRARQNVGSGRLAIRAGNTHHVEVATRVSKEGIRQVRHRRPSVINHDLYCIANIVELAFDDQCNGSCSHCGGRKLVAVNTIAGRAKEH